MNIKIQTQTIVLTLLLVTLTFSTFSTLAAQSLTNYQSASALSPQQVSSICRADYDQCLTLLPKFLASTELPEGAWYIYKMYQFEALFQLGHIEKLGQETAKFVDTNQGSNEFQFLTYTYYAKTLFSAGLEKKGLYYLDKAKRRYHQLKSTISNPIYLVNYANILLIEAHRLRKANNIKIAKRKYLEVKQLLLTIKKNYYHFNNANFQFELYGNLSHSAAFLDHHSASIEYAKKALFWSKHIDNEQQVGIAQFNLARSFQHAKQFAKARNAFAKSITYFSNANDLTSEFISYLRMIEVSLDSNDQRLVEQYFQRVDYLAEQIELNSNQIDWLNRLRSRT